MATLLTAAVDGNGCLMAQASQAVVPWWSVTKPLITAAAMRLCDQGRLDLDQPVPGWPYSWRQLLGHRSGLGDYGGLPDYHAAVAAGTAPWDDAALLSRVPPDRPLFAPGAGWAYSNVGYLLVRRALERLCDQPLAELLAHLVLRPLGLPSARLAVTVANMDGTVFAGGHGYDPGWVYHGTIIGPVSEAALALHRLLTGDLLSPSARTTMTARHDLGGPISGRPWLAPGYGLGLMVGRMGTALDQAIGVAGHSAGGPGSTGAVYHRLSPGPVRTVACFADSDDPAVTENEVVRHLLS